MTFLVNGIGLTLELAILSEKKSVEIISLLEELRRAGPGSKKELRDTQAEVLAEPAHPQTMLNRM